MKNIRAVLFDLDHTLWDFRANSRETIADLYQRHHLEASGVPSLDEFILVYERINHDMWNAYSLGTIGKEVLRKGRFANTLERFSIHDDALAEAFLILASATRCSCSNGVPLIGKFSTARWV